MRFAYKLGGSLAGFGLMLAGGATYLSTSATSFHKPMHAVKTDNPGTLFLIVGPSGSGKDTLLNGARERLKDNDDVVFQKRLVTRLPQECSHGETAVSNEDFAKLLDLGAFALWWHAYGTSYAVPKTMEEELLAGKRVVVNGSRSVIWAIRAKYPDHVRVVNITAPPEVLSKRLLARGREDEEAVRSRVRRASELVPKGPDVITIENVGSVEEGVETLQLALERC